MKNTTSTRRKSMFLTKIGMLAVFSPIFLSLFSACADTEPIDEDDIDPSINPPITFVEDDEDENSNEKEVECPDYGYNDNPLAFPGAEGYGRYVTGARGSGQREIYKVTNLNSSGSGSFKDAISKDNRIVVFAVAGILDMKKETYVLKSNQTILFQTAPGDGLTLFNGRVSGSSAGNVIVRYMRLRQGKGFGEGKDCFGIANGGNQIYDHCSFTWGGDETFSVNSDGKGTKPFNITLQNSIIGQGLQNHSAGGLMQTDLNKGSTIFRNLFIDNKTRNLKVKGLNQYVNNVVYNWGNGSCYDMGGDSEGNSNTTIVNNYFIKGPGNNWMNISYDKDFDWESYCAEDPNHRHFQTFTSDGKSLLIEEFVPVKPSKPISGASGKGVVSTYCVGNYYDHDTNGSLNGVEITQSNWGEYCSGSPVFLGTPDVIHPIIQNQTSAEEAYKYIVEKVGASLPKRDAVDNYLIEELTSLGKLGTILRDQRQEYQYPLANTWQNMDSSNNIVDTDGDGIPDEFEDKWGLNKKNKYDAVRTANNGYTNIENYALSLEFPEIYEEAYKKWINQ